MDVNALLRGGLAQQDDPADGQQQSAEQPPEKQPLTVNDLLRGTCRQGR